MSTLTVRVPKSLLLTSNQRLHWAEKARRTKAVRLLGRASSRGVASPGCPVHMTVTIAFGDRRRRDVMNTHPTVKAIVDGIVDWGLLPGDDTTVIESETYTATTGAPPGQTVFTIALEPVA